MRPRRLLVPALFALAVAGVAQERARERGKAVYREQSCWQCHTQARDAGFPAVGGSRRTGPVVDEPFLPRSEEWHRAHFFAPRAVVAGSLMPAYRKLFTEPDRAAAVHAFVEKHDARDGSHQQDGIVTQPEYARSDGADWEAALASLDRGDRVVSLADARPEPKAELRDLIRYVSSLEEAVPRAPVAAPARPKFDPAAAIARGGALYRRHCAGCHGDRGDGNGPAARFFDSPPRNFLRGEYRYRSTRPPLPPTDADLFRTIRSGAGPSMPAWPLFSDRQVWDLVEYLKGHHPAYLPRELFVRRGRETLAAFVLGSEEEPADVDDYSGGDFGSGRVVKRGGRWFWARGGRETPLRDGHELDGLVFRFGKPVYTWMPDFEPLPIALPEAPVAFTRESAEIGARVYREFGCVACHGDEGRGDGPASVTSRGSLGQVIRPFDYTRGARHFRGGADARSLVRLFLTGLPGTPMPAYGDNFAAAQSAPPGEAPWHLAHFVLRQAGVPFDR